MVWFLSGKNKIEPENGCYLFFHRSAYYTKNAESCPLCGEPLIIYSACKLNISNASKYARITLKRHVTFL